MMSGDIMMITDYQGMGQFKGCCAVQRAPLG